MNQSTLVDGQVFHWNERRLIVRSLKAANSSELALRERLQKAQKALSDLGERKRGKKVLRTRSDWHNATAEIIKRYPCCWTFTIKLSSRNQKNSKKKVWSSTGTTRINSLNFPDCQCR